MNTLVTPAVHSLVEELARAQGRWVFVQVLIRRGAPDADGFELRHVADESLAASELGTVPVAALREVAHATAAGAFRPLKSAPNLRRGWRSVAADVAALELALNHLYPGGLADWYAGRQPDPPVTHFPEFAARQTGMYRITATLSEARAAEMIRAGCHERFCLRRRLWTVPGLEPDAPGTRSVLPCLEPCPIVLELARRTARLDQEEPVSVSVGPGEAATLLAALELAAARAWESPAEGQREADTSAPSNPRRIQLLLERLRPRLPTLSEKPAAE